MSTVSGGATSAVMLQIIDVGVGVSVPDIRVDNCTGDYSFVAGDTGKLEEVADDLRESAKKLEEKIDEMYSLLESFPNDDAWSGATYLKFYEIVLQYKPVLESLIDVINGLANICDIDISNEVIVFQSLISRDLGLSFERSGGRGTRGR